MLSHWVTPLPYEPRLLGAPVHSSVPHPEIIPELGTEECCGKGEYSTLQGQNFFLGL